MDELEQSAEMSNSDAAAQSAAEEHEQAADQHDAQVDAASQEQPEEDEEIEIGGKKVAMPKSIAAEIKAGTMRNADYTQKTQAVAAERKVVEAEREQVRQQAAQHQQYLDDVADVRAIDKQLKQFAEFDWSRIIREDPVQAMELQQAQRQLEAERGAKVQSITQKQNEQALAEQQATAKQIQDAEAYVRREIPSWSPERTAQINTFAESQGVKMDPETARFLLKNPAFFKIMHNAELFDQLSKKQAAAKPATPAAPPAPVTRVGAARATAAKDPSKMSTSEWMEHRNKQLRSKR
ncbi:hypothetical protein [Massilia sp. TN1-12]|uniref:hypothetical protein n=1 Tax=Massilia paldalensis TaxID=3377675 RepID=UPI00384D1D4D